MTPTTENPQPSPDMSLAQALYLDLMMKCLTRSISPQKYTPLKPCYGTVKRALYVPLRNALRIFRLELVRRSANNLSHQVVYGHDWPAEAETMIGLRRLENIRDCVVGVLRHKVPGDLIETGCWRGGATILMRAILKAFGITDRTVWVADSFQGLPKPNADKYPKDSDDRLWSQEALNVPLEEVRRNFEKYGLLDDQVRFLVGWFRDSLPTAPISQLAILRLDGDLYESTMDGLTNLYPKVSIGGYVIVDDYGGMPGCKAAVEDFRAKHKITDEINKIDWTGVFWQRTR